MPALTDAEKALALQKELKRLERQAERTKEALQEALQHPDASNLATQLDQVTKAFEQQISIRGKMVETIGDIKEELRLLTAGTDDYIVVKERLDAAEASAAKTNRDMAASLAENSESAEKFKDLIDDLNNGVNVLPGRLAEAQEALGKFNKSVKVGDEMAETFTDKLVGVQSKGLAKVIGGMKDGKGMLKGFSSNMMDSTKMGAKLGSGLLKLAEASFKFAVEQDKVFSSFRKATGAGKEFNKLIKETEQSGRIAGVSLAESAQAVTALKNTFTDFTYLQPQVQKDIMHTTTILGEMGFSMETQAQIWQTATRAMGMGIKETQQFMLDLAGAAQSLGMDINKLGSEFAKNEQILVRFGKNSTKAFEELAQQSKATGAAVSTLLQFSENFKTFEDAGNTVGRLNAIMGGPFLNAIDMMNNALEDPAQNIRDLKTAFDQTGQSVDNFTGGEVELWASAMKLGTKEAMMILRESNEELELRNMKQAEADEQAQTMLTMTDQLSKAFQQLYLDAEPFVSDVLLPMIKSFAEFMGWIGQAINALGTFGSTALFVGTAVAGLMIATGVGSPFGIAALAVLGGAAVGALAHANQGEDESLLSAPSGLKGYRVGGRHIEGQATSPRSTSVSVVGEGGPELAELGTAGQISTASTTERLTKAMENVSADLGKLPTGGDRGDTHLAVSIAGEKIEELVIKSLRSPGARRVLGPYAQSGTA